MIQESKQEANRRRVRIHAARDPEGYRAKCRANEAARLAADPTFRANKRIRGVLWNAVASIKAGKSRSWCPCLGYSTRDLREHLECQFTADMNWANHGDVWTVDHIVPVVRFTQQGIFDPIVVNALPNLRPLIKADNASKGHRDQPLAPTFSREREEYTGEGHHLSKLTRDQVTDIKQSLAAGERGSVLARRYGVARNAIQQIKDGKSWRDLN